MWRLIAILTLLLISNTAEAKRLHPEAHYQNLWCAEQQGQTEYELDDLTRVDCLLEDKAVEFDFANKWAECIGQALYYGIKTDKQPVCAIIIEQPKDKRYIKRLKTVADKHNIQVEEITCQSDCECGSMEE